MRWSWVAQTFLSVPVSLCSESRHGIPLWSHQALARLGGPPWSSGAGCGVFSVWSRPWRPQMVWHRYSCLYNYRHRQKCWCHHPIQSMSINCSQEHSLWATSGRLPQSSVLATTLWTMLGTALSTTLLGRCRTRAWARFGGTDIPVCACQSTFRIQASYSSIVATSSALIGLSAMY